MLARVKRLDTSDAAALVRSRDSLAVPLGPGQPPAFLHALGPVPEYLHDANARILIIDDYAYAHLVERKHARVGLIGA